MDTNWMGRYRPLVAALVKHSNITKREEVPHDCGEGVILNNNEWQILEYIIEHKYDDENMIHISERLGIPQSTFSKVVKRLEQCNLVEKYVKSNNKKNIILRPTEHGLEKYKQNVNTGVQSRFKGFFDALDVFSDDQLQIFVDALEILDSSFEDSSKRRAEAVLIKKEYNEG